MNCSVLSLLANPSVGTCYQLQEYSRSLGPCNLRILWGHQEYSFMWHILYNCNLLQTTLIMINGIVTIPPMGVLHAWYTEVPGLQAGNKREPICWVPILCAEIIMGLFGLVNKNTIRSINKRTRGAITKIKIFSSRHCLREGGFYWIGLYMELHPSWTLEPWVFPGARILQPLRSSSGNLSQNSCSRKITQSIW